MATKRTLILGVTGSIAAYKAADLASQFKKAGHAVQCVMTRDATQFITPLTLQTISQHPVILDLFAEVPEWKPTHLPVADTADLQILIENEVEQVRQRLGQFAPEDLTDANKLSPLVSDAVTALIEIREASRRLEVALARRDAPPQPRAPPPRSPPTRPMDPVWQELPPPPVATPAPEPPPRRPSGPRTEVRSLGCRATDPA